MLVAQTLVGLERNATGPVLASSLKRAVLRKDPTFNESDHGFRSWSELIRHLAERGALEVHQGSAQGDPEVTVAAQGSDEDAAFALLGETVTRQGAKGTVYLSGLKTQLRRTQPDFTEKKFGYGGFLQFCKAARARGVIDMEFDEAAEDYVVRPGAPAPA